VHHNPQFRVVAYKCHLTFQNILKYCLIFGVKNFIELVLKEKKNHLILQNNSKMPLFSDIFEHFEKFNGIFN